MKSGYLIGVVGAEVNSIEQRQMLSGIIARAQENRARVVTLSNLYNPLEPARADCADNRIYSLIGSESFDAIVLLSESFVNPALRQNICELLKNRKPCPMICVGAPQPEFSALHMRNINTSDENDIAAVTAHLIEQCGFRRIALLSGPFSLEVSHTRLSGYRRALEQHGIPFDGSLVIEGDFWYYSGEKLAGEYLRGERPEPEALICANDYMAFGLLDAFSAAGADITEHMAVIGYEFIPERNLHTPLLTTYQRSRRALGEAAADILLRALRGEPEEPFLPPQGELIGGHTCPSPRAEIQPYEELQSARISRQFADWNLKSEMESQLTECRSIGEFAEIMGEYLFMVRDATDIVLCVYEDWFQPAEHSSRTLVCRNINRWTERRVFRVDQMQLPDVIRQCGNAAAGYLNPIFFKDRLLGFCLAWYQQPDTYDDTYRHWLKSVSNGLDFLRLKADVRYLLQCSAFSPSYDSMTGLFSADGLRDAFQLMQNAQAPKQVTAVAVRFQYAQEALNSTQNARETVSSLMAAVGVIKRFHGCGGIIGRFSEFDFVLLFPDAPDPPALLADAVCTEILSDADFLQYSGKVSCFAEGAAFRPAETGFPEMLAQITALLDRAQETRERNAALLHYDAMLRLHDALYRDPLRECSLQSAADSLHLNPNHFNRIYGQFFGVSFHRDHILARLRLAKHLLITADMTAAAAAEACGYTDSKYFIRQFSAETGLSPKRYRQIIRTYFA